MISVELPDGSARSRRRSNFSRPRPSIGPGLAKAAVAAKIGDDVVDLNRPLFDGAKVSLITKRDAEALEVLRHSAAHLMADAILVFQKLS